MTDTTNPTGVAVTEHSHGPVELGRDDGHRRTSTGSALHAFASFDPAAFPIPSGREEAWRFTPARRLRGLHQLDPQPAPPLPTEIDAAPEVKVEFVDRDDPRIGRTAVPTDRVAALAWSSFTQAVIVTVPRDTKASAPTTIREIPPTLKDVPSREKRIAGTGAETTPSLGYGHLVVDVEPYAEAVVVLDHVGSATYAANVELHVGEGGKLTFVAIQDWADDAVHLAHHYARLGRDASFKSVLVTFGGELVRLFPQVTYDAPGGDAELLGIYFADEGQHLEHRLFVDHAQPHCRSRVAYKGALQGASARTVWIGDVLIRKNAIGTDTYELNRNLVLTDGARADSVPNLEIETGEIIGAGHASATGRFDDEQLFYLQSRGIPEDEARRLVVRGFFAELVGRIGVPEVEVRLLAKVEEELSRTLRANARSVRPGPIVVSAPPPAPAATGTGPPAAQATTEYQEIRQ